MADNPVLSAILSATADNPADVAMQLSIWQNGPGQAPPPLEVNNIPTKVGSFGSD